MLEAPREAFRGAFAFKAFLTSSLYNPFASCTRGNIRASEGNPVNNGGSSAGIGFWGFGSMLAITLSWSVNHSILWMILHGIISWLYVIYFGIWK